MKTITVDCFDRSITKGITTDALADGSVSSFVKTFERSGFSVLFNYQDRTTLTKRGVVASILVTDTTPQDIINHGDNFGVDLTCIQYLYPS